MAAALVLKKDLKYFKILAYSRKLGNRRSSEGLQNFMPSNGNNLLTLIVLDRDIETKPGPRFLCRLCKKKTVDPRHFHCHLCITKTFPCNKQRFFRFKI